MTKWSLNRGGLLIQVVTRACFTVYRANYNSLSKDKMSCHITNVSAHFLVDLTKMAGMKWSALQSKMHKCSLSARACVRPKTELSVQNSAQPANLSV